MPKFVSKYMFDSCFERFFKSILGNFDQSDISGDQVECWLLSAMGIAITLSVSDHDYSSKVGCERKLVPDVFVVINGKVLTSIVEEIIPRWGYLTSRVIKGWWVRG